jgi:hypothetical protein
MNKNPSFLRAFGFGVLGLLVGTIFLIITAWPVGGVETASSAVLWALVRWPAAFFFGLLCLVIGGMRDRGTLLAAIVAFIVPVAVIAMAGLLCYAIYPQSSLADEISGFLPVTAVFYVFGWVWAALRRPVGVRGQALRAGLPPLVGGLMILAAVCYPIFTGNAFVYRDAFALDIERMEHPDGGMLAHGTLHVRKPGNYTFRAPALFFYEDFAGESADGSITWGSNGAPAANAEGSYPLKIAWDKVALAEFEMGFGEMEPGDLVILEVRSADDSGEVLISVPGKSADSATAGEAGE